MKNEILNKKFFFLDKDSKTKEEVFENAVDVLMKDKRIISRKDLLKNIFHRESLGPTFVGQGFAIPHGQSEGVLVPTILYVKTNHPIEWETSNHDLVKHIILFIIKNEKNQEDNLSIRKIMSHLGDEEFIEQLKKNHMDKNFKIFREIVEREEEYFA